jgi:hypothetical protein
MRRRPIWSAVLFRRPMQRPWAIPKRSKKIGGAAWVNIPMLTCQAVNNGMLTYEGAIRQSTLTKLSLLSYDR